MGKVDLSTFKAQIREVARPNRFWFTFYPGQSMMVPNDQVMFMTKIAQIPGVTIGEIPLNWQGMQFKLAGDPTFDDLTVSFINDIDFIARKFIESWLSLVVNVGKEAVNTRTYHADYKAEALAQQLDVDGNPLNIGYRFYGLYPKSMDQIELSMDSTDTAEEYSVTFGYDWWARE